MRRGEEERGEVRRGRSEERGGMRERGGLRGWEERGQGRSEERGGGEGKGRREDCQDPTVGKWSCTHNHIT